MSSLSLGQCQRVLLLVSKSGPFGWKVPFVRAVFHSSTIFCTDDKKKYVPYRPIMISFAMLRLIKQYWGGGATCGVQCMLADGTGNKLMHDGVFGDFMHRDGGSRNVSFFSGQRCIFQVISSRPNASHPISISFYAAIWAQFFRLKLFKTFKNRVVHFLCC